MFRIKIIKITRMSVAVNTKKSLKKEIQILANINKQLEILMVNHFQMENFHRLQKRLKKPINFHLDLKN